MKRKIMDDVDDCSRSLNNRLSSIEHNLAPVPSLADQKEILTTAVAIRFNRLTKCLDLFRFRESQLLTKNRLFVPLSDPTVLSAVFTLIPRNVRHGLHGLCLENNDIGTGVGLARLREFFPNLKTLDLAHNKLTDLKQLDGLSGFPIETLNLTGNPASDTAEDKERFIRNIRDMFPALKKLVRVPSDVYTLQDCI